MGWPKVRYTPVMLNWLNVSRTIQSQKSLSISSSWQRPLRLKRPMFATVLLCYCLNSLCSSHVCAATVSLYSIVVFRVFFNLTKPITTDYCLKRMVAFRSHWSCATLPWQWAVTVSACFTPNSKWLRAFCCVVWEFQLGSTFPHVHQ